MIARNANLLSVDNAIALRAELILHKNRNYAKMLVVEDLATAVLNLQDVRIGGAVFNSRLP